MLVQKRTKIGVAVSCQVFWSSLLPYLDDTWFSYSLSPSLSLSLSPSPSINMRVAMTDPRRDEMPEVD